MRCFLAALALLAASLVAPAMRSAGATALPSPASAPGTLCLAAIETAERAERIPAGLLRSIAHVESGRADPISGRVAPWPWTINAEGEGRYFESREAAIVATRSLLAAGIRSIDIGCAQVNLLHHPQAFDSLEQAFDPAANTGYAARFLRSLHVGLGSWPMAAAAYHSMTPERGHAYASRVAAIWPAAAQHGPWPLAPADLVLGAPGPLPPRLDYSIYTPAHAARLRRIDADRSRLAESALLPPVRGRSTGRDRLPPAPVLLLPAPRPVAQAQARGSPAPAARAVLLAQRGGT